MEPSTGMQSDRARVILEGGGSGIFLKNGLKIVHFRVFFAIKT